MCENYSREETIQEQKLYEEIRYVLFVYLHVSITEIHDNFREPYQYGKYLKVYATMMYLGMYTAGIIVQR